MSRDSDAILEAFKDILIRVDFATHLIRKGVEEYRAKVILIDGSNMRIAEKRVGSGLVKYSYYWLDEGNELIIGWDNAPHHPEVASHPHHKHVGMRGAVMSSDERDLEDAMQCIREAIRPD